MNDVATTLSVRKYPTWASLAIACAVVTVWAISLVILLSIPIAAQSLLWIPIVVICQTFLHTGLFITAHDAMHQSVCPTVPVLNHAIGVVALLLYGFLFYPTLSKKHWQHHQHPATELDPDFHDGHHTGLVLWYFRFMGGYWGWKNMAAIGVGYCITHHFFHSPHLNLLLFWAIPALLSSVQLFYFGTFLPHQEPPQGYSDAFRTRSIHRPFLWSLLTCYHFGYHYEHHQHTDIPWWRLPTAHPGYKSWRDPKAIG